MRYAVWAPVLAVSFAFMVAQTPSGQIEGAPEHAEQERILGLMRAFAEGYVSNLPNFLCDQETRQYEAGKKSKKWHEGDTLTSKLSFHNGEEQRTLQMVNGKPVEPGTKRWRTPLVTEGEFGILLSRVLGPESRASFTWSHWETVREKRLAVFDYNVTKEDSTLTLRLSDLAKAVVPYYGSVYGDPATGAVWRITDAASEIPLALQTREISTTIDYSEISIGEKTYLLPLQATVSLLLEDKKVRNEMDFRAYRKFEAESVIKFGEPGGGEAPKPKR